MKTTLLFLLIGTSVMAAKPKSKWMFGVAAAPRLIMTNVTNGSTHPTFFQTSGSSSLGFAATLKGEYAFSDNIQLFTGIDGVIHSIAFGGILQNSGAAVSQNFSVGEMKDNQLTLGAPIGLKFKFGKQHSAPILKLGYQLMYLIGDFHFAGLESGSGSPVYTKRDLHFASIAVGHHSDIRKGGAFEIDASFMLGLGSIHSPDFYDELGSGFAIKQSVIQLQGSWFFPGAGGKRRH